MSQVKDTEVKLLKTLEGNKMPVISLCFNDKSQLFSLSKENNIISWDFNYGEILGMFSESREPIKKLKYISSSKEIYYINNSKNILILNSDVLKSDGEIEFNLKHLIPLNFDINKTATLSIVAFSDNKIRVYTKDFKLYSTLSVNTQALLTNIAISPNSKIVCASFSDNTIKIWNISIIEPLKTLTGHSGHITSVIFSSDSNYIFTSSCDKTIKIWNVKTGENQATLTGHTGYVNSIDLTSDNKFLISVSHDLTAKIWSLKQLKEIKTIKDHISPVLSVAIHPDNKCFATGSSDKTIKIWELPKIDENFEQENPVNLSDFKIESKPLSDFIAIAGSNIQGLNQDKIKQEVINNNFDTQKTVKHDVYSLLSFNRNNTLTSSEFITPQTKKTLEQSIYKLELLTNKMNKNIGKRPNQIPETYRLFFNSLNNLDNVFDTVGRARRLAWGIAYSEGGNKAIIETNNFISALKIIDKFWTYTMFQGLFETYLKLWDHNNQNIIILKEFLSLKIANYNKNLSVLLKIKQNKRFFFNDSGNFYLAERFYILGKDLSKVFEEINLPTHTVSYNYFSGFITNYTQNVLNKGNIKNYLENIVRFLEDHKDKNTIKKCLSKMILAIDRLNDLDLQEEIKAHSFKMIGDPSIDSLWLPWKNATPQEVNEIKEAQNIINNWITSQFIDLFFSNVTMDIDRKNFWQKYLREIKKFKIYGTQYQYRVMKNDKRIEPYLSTRFGFLTGGGDQLNAFIMYIKDYILIEFSSTGNAFYGYKNSNPYCPDTSKRELRVSQLKRRGLSDLRITHSGDWQYTTSRELKNKIGV